MPKISNTQEGYACWAMISRIRELLATISAGFLSYQPGRIIWCPKSGSFWPVKHVKSAVSQPSCGESTALVHQRCWIASNFVRIQVSNRKDRLSWLIEIMTHRSRWLSGFEDMELCEESKKKDGLNALSSVYQTAINIITSKHWPMIGVIAIPTGLLGDNTQHL